MAEHNWRHVFLKSNGFKRVAKDLDAWAQVDQLKLVLDENPMLGDVIPGGDGLRKIRMALPGRGKSGGARVIYYQVVNDCILMLAIYAKNEKVDLTLGELEKAIKLRDDLLGEYKDAKK